VKKEIEDDYKLHHAIHLKREQNRVELEESKEHLQNERRKTVERLRKYKEVGLVDADSNLYWIALET